MLGPPAPPRRVPVLPQCHVVGGPWFGSDFCPFVCLFVLFGGSRSGLLTCCRIETPTGLVAPALVGETCLTPRGPRAARAALSFRPPGRLCALSVSRPRACSGQLLSPQLGAWRRRQPARPTAVCIPPRATRTRGAVKALAQVCCGHVPSFLRPARDGLCPGPARSRREPDAPHISPALGSVSVRAMPGARAGSQVGVCLAL